MKKNNGKCSNFAYRLGSASVLHFRRVARGAREKTSPRLIKASVLAAVRAQQRRDSKSIRIHGTDDAIPPFRYCFLSAGWLLSVISITITLRSFSIFSAEILKLTTQRGKLCTLRVIRLALPSDPFKFKSNQKHIDFPSMPFSCFVFPVPKSRSAAR